MKTDYTKLTFTELIDKIEVNRFFDLPRMVREAFKRLNTQSTPKYKVYTALLTQTGTDAPVATVLENTLGNIVWSRVDTGIYNGTMANTFLENKTIGFFNYNLSQGDEIFMTIERISLDAIQLINRTSTVVTQDSFSGQIEIRVYN
jgi:hypothetical protein